MTPRRAFALVLLSSAACTASAFAIFACSSDEEETKPARDAAVPDTSRAPEEDVDAAPPGDAARGPYCTTIDAASVVFCGDFENSASAPLYGFDDSVLTTGKDGGSSLAITDEGGVNHPSFVLDVALSQPPADAGSAGDAGASAFLTKKLPAGAPNGFLHHEVEMDFRVVGPGSLAYVAMSVLMFPAGAIKEHGFAVYDGNVFGRLAPKDFAVKDDKSLWHHARIVVDRPMGSATSASRVTIDIDGTLVDNVSGVDVGSTGTSSIRVGGFYTSPSAGGSIRAQFDNIVIRRW
jgi:hypothetical protein